MSPKPQSARRKTPRQRKSGVKRIKDFVKKKVFNGGRKRKKDTSSSSKEAVAGSNGNIIYVASFHTPGFLYEIFQ